MARVRFGLMTLLLVNATWRFTWGGAWMWAWTLGGGWAGAFLVALFPPWHEAVMRPRLAAWDAQHADAAERTLAETENRRSGWTAA